MIVFLLLFSLLQILHFLTKLYLCEITKRCTITFTRLLNLNLYQKNISPIPSFFTSTWEEMWLINHTSNLNSYSFYFYFLHYLFYFHKTIFSFLLFQIYLLFLLKKQRLSFFFNFKCIYSFGWIVQPMGNINYLFKKTFSIPFLNVSISSVEWFNREEISFAYISKN